MATDTILTTIASLGGLSVAAATTYITVRNYYDKRRNEDRERTDQELARLQAIRANELETYAAAKQKTYAAERDFGHLMRQYDGLTIAIAGLHDSQKESIDDLEADMKEVKGMLNVLLVHISGSDTAVMRFLKKPES